MSYGKSGPPPNNQIKNLTIALAEVLKEAEIHQKRFQSIEKNGKGKQAVQLSLIDSLERACNLISLTMNAQTGHIDKDTHAYLQAALDDARGRFFEQASKIVVKKLDAIGQAAQRTLDSYPEYPLGMAERLTRQLGEIMQAFDTVLGHQPADSPLRRTLDDIRRKVDAVQEIERLAGVREFNSRQKGAE